jgi:catechol 2,3-dioxygenase-like lactoylglutathione lyase family enzyme
MSDSLKVARALNHVAYPTTDTGATYRFYTEIMGFKLVAAVRGDQDPESGNSRSRICIPSSPCAAAR